MNEEINKATLEEMPIISGEMKEEGEKKRKRGKPKEKGNGQGTIYKSGKGYRGTVTLGSDPETGKLRRISVSGESKRVVSEKMAQVSASYQDGTYQFKNDITVRELSEIWLKHKKKVREFSKNSYIRYKNNIDNHINRIFGDYRVQDLTFDIIQDGYARGFNVMKTCDDGEEILYSDSTLSYISNKFKLCLDYAVKKGYIKYNPHIGVELHKLKPTKIVNAFKIQEQLKLTEFCKKSARDYLFIILLGTGVRIGEACGMVWDQVDFETNDIEIDRQMIEVGGNPEFQYYPKTPDGFRRIPMTSLVRKVLIEIKDSQIDGMNPMNLVFPARTGNFRTSTNLRKRWAIVCRDSGVNYRNPHACRHTWATRALESGMDIHVVSKMLGHRNVVTTYNKYGSVQPDYQMDSIKKMENHLAEKTAKLEKNRKS